MTNYPFFSVVGLEIEYMLVHKDSLDIAPQSDILIKQLAGKISNEIDLGKIALSNELVMHVIEMKNNGPQVLNSDIATHFHQTILQLQPFLDSMHLQLLPTGAHPWMNPHTEAKRWPHDSAEIYSQYDRIFDCRGHGWSNLQSMHINLPFNNDDEFSRLHNAIRILTPLLPAIAASSPILDGKETGIKDTRLLYYGVNQQKIPEISGAIVPEFIRSRNEYEQMILQPMYDAIHPLDPKKILQHEWLNSRSVIPKFDLNALEIRILDSQECPSADIAIAMAVCSILKKWCDNPDYYLDKPCNTAKLKSLYDRGVSSGLSVQVDDGDLFRQWKIPYKGKQNLSQIWSTILERNCSHLDTETQNILESILSRGNLSDRIMRVLGEDISRERLKSIYGELSKCLKSNHMFH